MARKNSQEAPANGSATATADAPATNGTTAPAAETRVEQPTDNPNVVRVQYKMAGAVPQALLDRVIWTPEAKNIQGLMALVEDGKEAHIVKLGQGALDVNRQRVIRAAASSKDVAEILSGEAEGTADLTQDERIARAVEYVQSASDDYIYGSITRGTGTGPTAKAKKFDAAKEKAKALAASDPAMLANLKAIFGEDFDINA